MSVSCRPRLKATENNSLDNQGRIESAPDQRETDIDFFAWNKKISVCESSLDLHYKQMQMTPLSA